MISAEDLLYYGHPYNRGPLNLYQHHRNNSNNRAPGLTPNQFVRSDDDLALHHRSYSVSPPPSPSESSPPSTGSQSSLRSLTVYLVTPLPVPKWMNPSLNDIYEKVFLYVDNDPRLSPSIIGQSPQSAATSLATPVVASTSPVHEVLNRLLNAGFAVKQFDRNEVLVESDMDGELKEVRCAIWTLINNKFSLPQEPQDLIDPGFDDGSSFGSWPPSPCYSGSDLFDDGDFWIVKSSSYPPTNRMPQRRTSLPAISSKPNINRRRMSSVSSSKRMGEPSAGQSVRKRFVGWFRRLTSGCLNKTVPSNGDRGKLLGMKEY